jgi:BioD-like phosphotransacetylase family protein
MPTDLKNVIFQAPLFHADNLAENMNIANKFITSSTQLAAAVRLAKKDADAANFSTTPAISAEVTDVYNAVISDGRYIKDFSIDPGGVAVKLGKNLSAPSIAAVKAAGKFRGADPGVAASSVEVVCVAVIVVLCAKPSAGAEVIVDSSGQLKL